MALTLDLSEEQEARLRAEAARQGLAAEEYALRLLERGLPASGPGSLWHALSTEEWIRHTREWAESHRDWPVLSDEAMSRESFYDDPRQ